MKLKINHLLALILMLFVQISFAQEKKVTGKVTDVAGMPLSGVSVIVKGTKTGTQTDFDGTFTINDVTGKTLVFSYTGMKSQQAAASNGMRVNLSEDAVELEGIIVTSQGIKREKKALGYAVSQVKSKDIEQRTEGDIARVLSGKASGVNIINGSGISGSATNINIRGFYTVNGSSQPLFIVDGVPFGSSTSTNAGSTGGNNNDGRNDFINGSSGSSRFLDIDPNNIESVNVLKGYAAATLYGTEGRNGVILITTKSGGKKKGPKKTEISVSQSVFSNQIASLPDYQNTFGNGFDQAYGNFFSNWGPGFYANGLGGYNNPNTGIAPDGTIADPYSRANLNAVFPEYIGKRIPYTAKPDNVRDFFRTGIVLNTSVNVSGTTADGKTSLNLNYGRLEDEGFTRGNNLTRNNISIGGQTQLSNKFTVNGTINLAITNFRSPPVASGDGSGITGTGLSVFSQVLFTPRNIDIMGYPSQSPIDGSAVYYRGDGAVVNPNWIINNAFQSQITNRSFGNASIKYEINNNLNLSYRVGIDIFNERNEAGTNKGSARGPVLGDYRTYDNMNTIWDHNFLLDGKYDLGNKFKLSFNLGATSRSEALDRQGVRSVDQIAYGIFRHFDFRTQTAIQYTQKRNIVGLYGQAEVEYNNWAYITLSTRKDWVSNTFLNTISYPSASTSFIITNLAPSLVSEKGLNYLKLRAGYGTSAGFTSGYPVTNILSLNANGSQDQGGVNLPTSSVVSTLGNPNLRPELLSELEFGVETKFLNNRVTLDFSYYKRQTTDLITNNPLPPSQGFTQTLTNIGKVEGDGIEIDLGLSIFKNANRGFTWDINGNFSKSKSIVTDLGELAQDRKIVYSGFSNLGNAAIEGEQLGVIVGTSVARNPNGQKIIQDDGTYLTDQQVKIIGNPNPDFVLNVNNEFTFKNFNFGFLVNYTHGGDIYSTTISTLMGRGLTTDTLDRLNTFVLPGVKQDGTPNNIQINNSTYYFSNLVGGASELSIYDASVVRLQELSFGYTIPTKYLDKLPFGSLSFKFSGNNLYYEALNTPKGVNFDPNVAGVGSGNGRGFDFLNGPSAKRFGFSIKATF